MSPDGGTEWSDWYAREDPTRWVLAEILRAKAAEHPDREYLRYGEGGWISYGEVNARANRWQYIVASVPDAQNRSRSAAGQTRAISSARARAWGLR